MCSSQNKQYLGDGVYAEYSETANFVKLTTEDGLHVKNMIILEPEIWFQLKDYIKRYWKDGR